MTTYQTKLLETIELLPQEYIQELLDFGDFLKDKFSKQKEDFQDIQLFKKAKEDKTDIKSIDEILKENF